MELCIDSYTISNVFSFLDIKSIINYDNAIINKELRPLYLLAISKLKLKLIRANKWSFLRNIKILNTNCKYYNLDYFPKYNKNLTICGSHNFKTRYDLSIIKHDIEHLHIDITHNYNLFITEIEGKNIKTIVFIYVRNINKSLLKNISMFCPKLEKISFIKCTGIPLEELINNKKINIFIAE